MAITISPTRRVLLVTCALLAGSAAPAAAINHPFIPADECGRSAQAGGPTVDPSPGNPVGVPASSQNPGVSVGARGGERSVAADRCSGQR